MTRTSRKHRLLLFAGAVALTALAAPAAPAIARASGGPLGAPAAAHRAAAAPGAAAVARAAPEDLTATAVVRDDGGWRLDNLRLTWRPGPGTAPTAYQVWLNGAFAQQVLFGAPTSGTVTHYVNVGESPGTTFRVKIRAMLASGEWSAFSNEYTITTAK